MLMLSLWIMGQDSMDYRQPIVVGSDTALFPDLHLSYPVSSGNSQQQMVDFTLPEPIRVLVTDGEGQPVPLLLGSNLGTAVTAIVPPDRIMEEVKPQTMYLDRRFIQTTSLHSPVRMWDKKGWMRLSRSCM